MYTCIEEQETAIKELKSKLLTTRKQKDDLVRRLVESTKKHHLLSEIVNQISEIEETQETLDRVYNKHLINYEERSEYEDKLEKIKDKVLKICKDAVSLKITKVKSEHGEVAYFQKTIDELRNELSDAEQNTHMLEVERDVLKTNYLSRTLNQENQNDLVYLRNTEGEKIHRK